LVSQSILKRNLAVRPVFHQDDKQIEAHIFIALLADCMRITLTCRLRASAPALTARGALDTFAAVQMIDVPLLQPIDLQQADISKTRRSAMPR
jgi:hypothetical protein